MSLAALLNWLVSALVGAAIGLRYKVLVLVPATCAEIFGSVVTTVALDHDAWSILTTTASGVVGIQMGYLCSGFACSAMPAPRQEISTSDHLIGSAAMDGPPRTRSALCFRHPIRSISNPPPV